MILFRTVYIELYFYRCFVAKFGPSIKGISAYIWLSFKTILCLLVYGSRKNAQNMGEVSRYPNFESPARRTRPIKFHKTLVQYISIYIIELINYQCLNFTYVHKYICMLSNFSKLLLRVKLRFVSRDNYTYRRFAIAISTVLWCNGTFSLTIFVELVSEARSAGDPQTDPMHGAMSMHIHCIRSCNCVHTNVWCILLLNYIVSHLHS